MFLRQKFLPQEFPGMMLFFSRFLVAANPRGEIGVIFQSYCSSLDQQNRRVTVLTGYNE